MIRYAGTSHVNNIVGSDGLDREALGGYDISVFHHEGILDLLCRDFRGDDDRPVLGDRIEGLQVEMVPQGARA